jgi:DNA-binding NarL/FixJ family response regulator
MTLRVVLVDDQPLMRTAFRTILEAAGVEVVGEAADGDEAVGVVDRTVPDVVLMDVRMPGRDGIDATAEVVARVPSVRVLVLTTFDEDAHIDGALRAGAAGFLLKNASPEDLVRAVRTVAAGDNVLDPAVTGRVMARVAATAPAAASAAHARALARLTEREKDVLHLVASGCTNAEVAERLGVGDATAKTHVSRVLAKLGVRDRVQAVIVAYESGFATTPRALG